MRNHETSLIPPHVAPVGNVWVCMQQYWYALAGHASVEGFSPINSPSSYSLFFSSLSFLKLSRPSLIHFRQIPLVRLNLFPWLPSLCKTLQSDHHLHYEQHLCSQQAPEIGPWQACNPAPTRLKHCPTL